MRICREWETLCEARRTGPKIALTGKKGRLGGGWFPACLYSGRRHVRQASHLHTGTKTGPGPEARPLGSGGAEVPLSGSMPLAQPCRGTRGTLLLLPHSACGRSGSSESGALSRHPGSTSEDKAFGRERGSGCLWGPPSHVGGEKHHLLGE